MAACSYTPFDGAVFLLLPQDARGNFNEHCLTYTNQEDKMSFVNYVRIL